MVQHHFLVLAYPAQGHLNPVLQFSKRLVGMGVRVTLFITVSTLRRMTKKPVIDGLSLVTFSDGYDDGFTPSNDAEAMLYLSDLKRCGTEALTNLGISQEKEGPPFTFLVYSLFHTWAAEVARGLHLPSALLWIQPATVLDIYYYYLRNYSDYIKEKTKDPKSSIELPGVPLLKTRDLPSFLQPSTDYYFCILWLEEHLQQLEKERKPRVLVNTFEALEPEALRAVDKLEMISIGPLIPSAFLDRKNPDDTSFGGDIFDGSNSNYIEWLASKEESSVVYVSFGSFSILSERQMKEIARALLDTGRPFLWVIRDSKEKKGKEEKKEEEQEKLNCREGEEEEEERLREKENKVEKQENGKEEEEEEELKGREKEEKLKCRGGEVKEGLSEKENKVEKRENGKEEVEEGLKGREKEKKGEEQRDKPQDNEEEEEEELRWRKELEGKGKIVKWCSQVEVLSHPSVGCFMTHCGWNSTMESLVSGVPVVAFPQWTDQGTNAKLIEDVWKTGIKVVVNEDGLGESEEIRRCLEVVMGRGEKGQEMRKNANKWKDLARQAVMEGGSSYKNLRALLDEFGEANGC